MRPSLCGSAKSKSEKPNGNGSWTRSESEPSWPRQHGMRLSSGSWSKQRRHGDFGSGF